LKAVANDIDNDLIPLEEYAITRQLAKPLEYYTDPKALPHVKVAKRLKEKGETWIKVNAYIPYIVCKPNSNENSKSSIAERSYHPKELKEDSSLIIDKTWYKENQVLSIIRRLVKHIEEITLQQLCECLGIEHKHYYTSQNENKTDIETIGYNGVNGMNDYIGLEVSRGIVLTCSSCKTPRRINKMRTRNETINDIVLCTGCNQTLKNFGYVVNVIMKAVKDVMFAFGSKKKTCYKCKYYQTYSFMIHSCTDKTCKGELHKDMNEGSAVQEMKFLYYLVTTASHYEKKNNIVNEFDNAVKEIEKYVENAYNKIKYRKLNMRELFSFLLPHER
jgi:hypothetical protein